MAHAPSFKRLAFLAPFIAFDKLLAVASPGAYRGLTLREQFGLLVHIDHEGRQALPMLSMAAVACFMPPAGG